MMLTIWYWFAGLVVDFFAMLDSVNLFGSVSFLGLLLGAYVFGRFLSWILYVFLDYVPNVPGSIIGAEHLHDYAKWKAGAPEREAEMARRKADYEQRKLEYQTRARKAELRDQQFWRDVDRRNQAWEARKNHKKL